MLTNLIIPVQDTESAEFRYDGNLTREAYETAVLDHFNKTDRQIDAFLHRDRSRNNFTYDLNDNGYNEYNEIYTDNEVEVEALLLDGNRVDFKEDFLFDMIDEGRMFILIVNINPEGINEDAESEIKYWLEDSFRVWNDDTIDRSTKLKVTPPRDLKIKLSDGQTYTLGNCKIFEDYSDDRFPLYFAMLVERITD